MRPGKVYVLNIDSLTESLSQLVSSIPIPMLQTGEAEKTEEAENKSFVQSAL